MKSLRQSLVEWTDADIAEYYLAAALGLVDDPEPWNGKKHVFWSNNPIGNVLYEQLRQLAAVGILEFDEGETRFRWNSSFVLP